MSRRVLSAACETYDLARPFTISRGTLDSLTVLTVTVRDGDCVGRGECVPSSARMLSRDEGQRAAAMARDEVLALSTAVEQGLDRAPLQQVLPAGPARNAVDCALWDLEAKQTRRSVADMLGIEMPATLVTAQTIPLGTPERMADDAARHAAQPLLKVKLGGNHDAEALTAVREHAPAATLIVDANEAWSIEALQSLLPALQAARVQLIEQPLPATNDDALEHFRAPIPLCADESCRDRRDLDRVMGRYQAVNIKLDKTGGLTEAFALARAARERGLMLMTGCMAGTSLSMAPAALIGALSAFVDLDGPLLLRHDRSGGYEYGGGRFAPHRPALWG